MSDERHEQAGSSCNPDQPEKRPYETPSVEWVEKLGVKPGLAVACARAVMQDPMCAAGGLAS